jgi:hypothetical protein
VEWPRLLGWPSEAAGVSGPDSENGLGELFSFIFFSSQISFAKINK